MKHKYQYLTYKERAQIYDIEYTECSDQQFLKYFINEAHNILEVPCGTGRNINLYEGKRACFVDKESEMIERIKTKILDLDRFSFLCGDICDFRISNKFDLIIIPREAFQLLVDEKKAEQALRNLRLHLKNSGKMIIDLYRFGSLDYNNQAPIYYHHEINEGRFILNWSRRSGDTLIKRFSMHELNGRVLKVTYKYDLLKEGHNIKYSQILLKNYDYNNFLGLIMRSGLRVKETFGDYNFSHYTEKDNRMIFIIEKGE